MRNIQPGYSTGNCSTELYEKVNCGFSAQLYARFVQAHYGVESCLQDRFDEYLIKKRLLDLNMIYDPEMCVTPPCCAPCGVTATLKVFYVNSCPAPRNVSAQVTVTPITCTAPSGVNAVINYQSLDD